MKLFQHINYQVISRAVLLLAGVLYSEFSHGQVLPLSDLQNDGNWELNTNVSDEFNNGTLDLAKWQIQGTNGVYKSNFIGRAPSQFNPNNAIVEDNKLKILTKWEPDFPFSSTPQDGVAYENITTAAVISKAQFHYGYMEIRSKAANAEITSSFWTTGYQSEIDMFEMFGDTDPGEANISWKKRLKFNMISWDPNNPYYLPDGNGPAHTRNIQADDNTADDFHVYGFEWTDQYIKVYIDGVLHPNGTILKSEITNNGLDPDRWVTDVPYWIWFDSETFPWLGIPEQADLMDPAEYQIDYIRVWGKKNDINPDFFGFESPLEIDGVDENWYIPVASAANMSINTERSYRWQNALKFSHSGALENNALAFSPFGSLSLEDEDLELSLKVWIEPGSVINNFQVILENPFIVLDFDVSGLETGKWLTVSQMVSRNNSSESNDRLRIRIRPIDIGAGSSIMYIDDITINSTSQLSIEDSEMVRTNYKVYPNPIRMSSQNTVNISAPNASEISLYSINGSKLITQTKTSEPFEFQLSNLKSGIYFITITSESETVDTKKLIIN